MDGYDSRITKLLDILELSKSCQVDQLTEEKLERCFKWAEYFQKVYNHAREDEAVMTTFDRQLRLMDGSKMHLFGEEPLSLETLNKSCSILCDNFLSNIYFPPGLLVSLVSKIDSLPKDSGSSNSGFSATFVEKIAQAVHDRAVWKHVSMARGNLNCPGRTTALLLDKLKLENDASFLRKSLESVVRTVDMEKAAHLKKYRQRQVEKTSTVFSKLRLGGEDREKEALETALTSLTDVCDQPYDCYVQQDSITFQAFLHWYKSTWCDEQRVVARVDDGLLLRILPRYPLLLECVVDALVFCVERADIEECILNTSSGRNEFALDTRRKVDLLLTSKQTSTDVNRLFRARINSHSSIRQLLAKRQKLAYPLAH